MIRSIPRLATTVLLASAAAACTAGMDEKLQRPDMGLEYVALQQSVRLNPIKVTPLRVLEDSRCPEQTTCIWAGRLVAETLINGPDRQQTVDLVLSEPQVVDGIAVLLSSVIPYATTEGETKPADYRFAFKIVGPG